jgi:hypothetical protein
MIDRIASDPGLLDAVRVAHAQARARFGELDGAPQRLKLDVFLFSEFASGGGGGISETLPMIRQGGQLGGGGGGKPPRPIVMNGIIPAGATVTLTFPHIPGHPREERGQQP